ncbi:MAG: methyltransferase domain-containing protein [Desulfobulbaceae bacterium]|nr:methyltransferase domain-containing protein [Desulfobulbaceae bacterium]
MLDTWQPLTFEEQTIYINPARPDWLVPGPEARRLLTAPPNTPAKALARAQLENQLNSAAADPGYRGRGAHLHLTALRECWFHLTSRCNLSCRHCLFSCSPAGQQDLAPELLAQGLREAQDLGSTLIYFTGGEPLLYPDFPQILAALLAAPALHAVVLTNGLLLPQHLAELTALPKERLHFQISLDGLAAHHDHLRGPGTFRRLLTILGTLREQDFLVTLSVAVNQVNIADLPEIVSLAADLGVRNLHFLWHFIRGQGNSAQFVAPAQIFPQLVKAQGIAAARGLSIDNIEALRSQIFSAPGTRFDLSNTGWESLAVGPDGNIYPSPALVGLAELNCGPLAAGLAQVWRQSPVLDGIRQTSWLDSPATASRPLSALTGGGDLDHSYLHGGEFVGHDPYLELYESLALWLIAERAARYPLRNPGELILRMGDVRHDCPDGGQPVSLTHCNCVVALSGANGHRAVQEFYGQAAVSTNADIVNPFGPKEGLNFIPLVSQSRSYGCGSPVQDAAPQPGEVLVDLGSGSGVECFLAAAQVGPTGKVFGIDMTPEMLRLARESQVSVAAKLGYHNVEFRQGFLEAIPLPDNSADVVISNCVINLSPDKRTTFHEIHRVLKPGGRLVVSDIVTDTAIPISIKNNAKFRGECLGGALQQEQLLAMLRAAGFTESRLLRRFPYRREGGTSFHSLTYSCKKAVSPRETVAVIYRGPLAALLSESGDLIFPGRPTLMAAPLAAQLSDDFFILDQLGGVVNQNASNACGCGQEPEPQLLPKPCCATAPPTHPFTTALPLLALPIQDNTAPSLPGRLQHKHAQGCLICGREINYLSHPTPATCHFCGQLCETAVTCPEHFVCDRCHLADGVPVIKRVCGSSNEKDLFSLLHLLRAHPALAMHGPEHHALVPGVILACYRNNGGEISASAIMTGIDRGSKIPGGVCGFWGGCGAALGVGIAFAVIMESNPLAPKARQQSQRITARVIERLAKTRGARCCRRESLTALREAAAIAEEHLGVTIPAKDKRGCDQSARNRECLKRGCSFWGEGD